MSELQEKGVSNNEFFRIISNAFDSIPGFKDSPIRANIHGLYHDAVGTLKSFAGNEEGAQAEFSRAQEQYYKASQGLPGEYGD